MGHAVGHIAGVQGRAAQHPCQSQRAGACIQIDEIFRQDQFCCRLGDALFLTDGQLFLGGHGGLVGAEGAVRQGGPAVHLVQFALLVQLVQVAPDGGFACVQRLAQLLHGGGALPRQQIQNQAESFFCQHREHSPLFDLYDWF